MFERMSDFLKFTVANTRGLNNVKIAKIKNAFLKGEIDFYILSETQHKNLNKFGSLFGKDFEIASNDQS